MADEKTDDRGPTTGKTRSDRVTSDRVASQASKVLHDPTSSDAERSVAASALSQAESTAARGPATDEKKDAAVGGQPSSVVAEAKPKRLLQFHPDQKSPTVDLQMGEYHRIFKASEQPFVAESKEEEQMLLRTRHFVKATDGGGPKADEES